jgi:glycosyltransferase involved in cell wall biosynthesis
MKPQVDNLVTVVIPAYNAGAFVAEAVASALNQTYPMMEIVVVDDGSADNTAGVLRQFGNTIRVIRQSNSGSAAARNRALAEASGEFIAFLDADDCWHPAKIERQLDCLRRYQNAVLVHTAVKYLTADGRGASWPQRFDPARYAGRCTIPLLQNNGITASSVLVRRSALPSPAFRERRNGCEDWDLWLRLSLVGLFECVRDPLTFYRLYVGWSANQKMMQRSAVQVLESFVEEPLSDGERCEAMRQLKLARLAYANTVYDEGHFTEAKELFSKAGLSWSSTDLQRRLACWLPDVLRSRLRRVKRILSPFE